MSTTPDAKRGFTLLELLVVIAIMALLLALLLPSLSSAYELGRSTVCGTQLNQLFQGSFRYSKENDDRIPFYAWMEGRPDKEEWWVTQISRGMDQFEPSIFRCPSDPYPQANIHVYYHNGLAYMADRGRPKSLPLRTNTRIRRYRLQVTYRGSCDMVESVLYYYRGARLGQLSIGSHMQGRRITAWDRPHEAIELVEGIAKETYEPNPNNQRECFRFIGDLSTLANGKNRARFSPKNVHANYGTWERHFGSTNVQFVDGHIGSHLPPEIGELAKRQEPKL